MSDLVTLDDLVQPIGADRFVNEHWLPELPFLSEPNPELVARLRDMDVFASPETLCRPTHSTDVTLLGPHQFRGVVAASQAHAFMHQGYTLYIRHLDAQVPEVRELSHGAAEALGSANLTVNVEAFVARAGAISSAHFDHDINFQILLAGRKRWRVAANRHVRNPFQGYHPAKQPDGSYQVDLDEAYARDPDVPLVRCPSRTGCSRRLRVPSCSCRALGGTKSILSRTASRLTSRSPDRRGRTASRSRSAMCSMATRVSARVLLWRARTDRGGRESACRDQAIRGVAPAQAIEQLEAITLEEVYLAGRDGRWRWAASARERSIVETAAGWALAVPGVADEPLELDDAALGLMRKLMRARASV